MSLWVRRSLKWRRQKEPEHRGGCRAQQQITAPPQESSSLGDTMAGGVPGIPTLHMDRKLAPDSPSRTLSIIPIPATNSGP